MRVFFSLFVSFTGSVLCCTFMWGWNPHFFHFIYRFVVFFGLFTYSLFVSQLYPSLTNALHIRLIRSLPTLCVFVRFKSLSGKCNKLLSFILSALRFLCVCDIRAFRRGIVLHIYSSAVITVWYLLALLIGLSHRLIHSAISYCYQFCRLVGLVHPFVVSISYSLYYYCPGLICLSGSLLCCCRLVAF